MSKYYHHHQYNNSSNLVSTASTSHRDEHVNASPHLVLTTTLRQFQQLTPFFQTKKQGFRGEVTFQGHRERKRVARLGFDAKSA